MPLSLIGVGLLLWLTGTPMSAPVLLGVILLAGIVVNNAILLVGTGADVRRGDVRGIDPGRRGPRRRLGAGVGYALGGVGTGSKGSSSGGGWNSKKSMKRSFFSR